jgi:hypothetical protein
VLFQPILYNIVLIEYDILHAWRPLSGLPAGESDWGLDEEGKQIDPCPAWPAGEERLQRGAIEYCL